MTTTAIPKKARTCGAWATVAPCPNNRVATSVATSRSNAQRCQLALLQPLREQRLIPYRIAVLQEAGKTITNVACFEEDAMPEHSADQGKVIVLHDLKDVRAWCNLLGCSEAQLRLAVRAVGSSAEAVRAYLLRNP